IPKMVCFVMIPPSLYKSIDRWGTLGGARDSLPVILKWGSLIFGSSSFMPEKKPLILSTIPLIVFLAASIGFVMAVLIPFHTVVAVLLIPLNTLEAVLFTALNTEETLFLFPPTTVEITDLIPFHTEEATDLMALKTEVTVFLMVLTTADTLLLMAFQMEPITFWIAPMMLEITPEMADSTELTVSLIPFQTEMTISLQFSQINRNGSVMMSTAPWIVEPSSITAVCTTLQMPFQTFCRCVQRLENHVFTLSIMVPIPVQMVFHRFPNHSVMAPQFWMMAIIPAMAAATAAI